MSDRLEEIKGRYDWHNQNGDFFYEAVICGEKVQLVKDMGWLISELEKCRAERKVEQEKYLTWIAKGLLTAQEWKDEADKQRRHRKWALKKARNLWVVISMARRWGRHD